MKPELLSPAGNLEKLEYAYRYGADSAYIGVGDFSLRARAGNSSDITPDFVRKIKGERKLYGALNIFFYDNDIDRLSSSLEELVDYPFDALIVSDPGVLRIVRNAFPKIDLHLSTQANCLNSDSARFYRDAGFRRIVLGRELSLSQIGRIRNEVPDVEFEVFVHGAMCLAYSGRCFLSAEFTGRSANQGGCAHSCRWDYRVLEEQKRPGEYYPINEEDGYTSILSSKDLCMFDYLPQLIDTGVDALKIEGRMKSLYYTAITTASYRAAIDSALGNVVEDLGRFRRELGRVSHREYSTGFFFSDADSVRPTEKEYLRDRTFLGTVGEIDPELGSYRLLVKNQICLGDTIEYIGPECRVLRDSTFELFDGSNNSIERANHQSNSWIKTNRDISQGMIVRSVPIEG